MLKTLNLSEVQEKYPKELVARCKKSRNQIVRTEEWGNPVSHGRRRASVQTASPLTLREMVEPEPFRFYDNFQISDFSFSGQTGTGHLKAEISLLNRYENIEIEAHILDVKNERVMGKALVVRDERTNVLLLDYNFSVDAEDDLQLAVLAHGKWGDDRLQKNEVTVYKEANMPYEGVKYLHKYPKKEAEAKILGKLEAYHPQEDGRGDRNHIVIALVRMPKDLNDVDYVCGAPRIGGSPNVCVPGEGTIIFPGGESPVISSEYPNSARCMLFRREGGAAEIARSDVQEKGKYNTSNITITPTGNGFTYQFLAWGVPYTDSAQWKKTEFDYRLELTLNAQRRDGSWVTRNFYIDTRDPDISITDEVLKIEIMYGCVAPDTKIRMSDGSEKQICEIQIGEVVTGREGKAMRVSNVWRGQEMEPMVKIFAKDIPEGLFATKTHPILVRDRNGEEKWKRAGECSMEDSVLAADGREFRPIVEIREQKTSGEVYNLDLQPLDDTASGFGTMFCNGILTGDNQIQNGKFNLSGMTGMGD